MMRLKGRYIMTTFAAYASTDLTGQIALVTGATSGLGWQFAQVLANAGAQVAVAGRRQERLDEIVELIESQGGIAKAYVLDTSDMSAIETCVERITHEMGIISILVNNAGIPDAAMATKIPLDLIDQVLNVNLKGPFVLAREIAKRLIKSKRPGRIVNISSIAAFDYDGNGAALYSVTKAGIARMTEALAVEWSKFHINVNAIAPGAFSSEMLDGMLERMGNISQRFPRKRLGKPSQMDSTLLYLCAPSSECVTGTVIKIDDGQMKR
jgi:NAD(P)-dependent dehydrogenase (short-subunit alcohol dehydrogenase family)